LVAESVGKVLIGKIPDDAAIDDAARAALEDACPIDDHRGSAWYRLHMVEVLTRRLLHTTVARAGAKA